MFSVIGSFWYILEIIHNRSKDPEDILLSSLRRKHVFIASVLWILLPDEFDESAAKTLLSEKSPARKNKAPDRQSSRWTKFKGRRAARWWRRQQQEQHGSINSQLS